MKRTASETTSAKVLTQPVTDADVSKVNRTYETLGLKLSDAECRLPFVVEFLGTPKAGKTSVRNMIGRLAEKHTFRVYCPNEGASTPSRRAIRQHLAAFNTLNACYALDQLLSKCIPRNQCDLLLLDRGIIDAQVWFEVLRKEEIITTQNAKSAQAFFALPPWVGLVDAFVLMTCNPRESNRRELRSQLARTGNLATSMPFLEALNSIYLSSSFFEQLHVSGKPILHVDTSSEHCDMPKTAFVVAEWLARLLDTRLVPSYLTIPRDLINFKGYLPADRAPISLWEGALDYAPKDHAETDSSRKQIVACAYIAVGDKLLRLHRTGHANRPELQGKLSLAVGGHAEPGDAKNGDDLLEVLLNCVRRELEEELVFDRAPDLRLLGFINDESVEAGRYHMAAVYRAKFSGGRVAVRPEVSDQEFGARSWASVSREQVFAASKDYDPWSQWIIESVLGGPAVSHDGQELLEI